MSKTKLLSQKSQCNKNSNVPKLRFPEFSGEWEKTTLGEKEISDFIKDRVALNQLDIKTYISTENLLSNYSGIKIATKLPPSGSFVQFKKKDILISNIRPYLKKVWQATINGNSSNDVIVIRAKTKVIDSFLAYILKNDNFMDYVMKNAKGTKMPRGDLSSIKKYSLFYPKKREQKKIADCLSSFDDLINVQTQKLESLKTHKKGLMQQLFPAEGKTTPKLRFPEFSGEWESRKLGDITDIIMGQSPDSTSYNSDGIGTYLIQGNADIKNKNTSPRIWTNTPIKECKTGDIIMTVRAPVGAIAKSVHNACIGRGVCAIRSNQHSISNYLYQFLLNFENQWIKFEQGSTFTAVNTKDVKSLKLNLPTKPEQQKIAACLTSLDDLITRQTQKIESLKTHKKGLMQQLFPNTDKIN